MDKETSQALLRVANISSMGIALGLTIFGCFFIGLYLDRKLGTGYFFAFVFLLLGIVVGFKNIYVLVKRSIADEKPAGDKERADREKFSAKKD
ncbi:MAG: AtpZ/AtpI family protein [Syntrophales bacterium]